MLSNNAVISSSDGTEVALASITQILKSGIPGADFANVGMRAGFHRWKVSLYGSDGSLGFDIGFGLWTGMMESWRYMSL